MKIKAGKHTAFEVKFFAFSLIGDDWWKFRLPTIDVKRMPYFIKIRFYAFFWVAGVSVEKVNK